MLLSRSFLDLVQLIPSFEFVGTQCISCSYGACVRLCARAYLLVCVRARVCARSL